MSVTGRSGGLSHSSHAVGLFGVISRNVAITAKTIKKLEPLYDFQRTVGLTDAATVLARVQECLELGDVDAVGVPERTAVEGYNRDDCFSAWKLRDWNENLALRNKKLLQRELNFAVQRIIDRIIFLRRALRQRWRYINAPRDDLPSIGRPKRKARASCEREGPK